MLQDDTTIKGENSLRFQLGCELSIYNARQIGITLHCRAVLILSILVFDCFVTRNGTHFFPSFSLPFIYISKQIYENALHLYFSSLNPLHVFYMFEDVQMQLINIIVCAERERERAHGLMLAYIIANIYDRLFIFI